MIPSCSNTLSSYPCLETNRILTCVNRWLETEPTTERLKKIAQTEFTRFLSEKEKTNIDLQDLNLSSIPDIWNSPLFTERLFFLNLSKNSLTTLPSSVGNLINLKKLNLSYNPNLMSLPEEASPPSSCSINLENSGIILSLKKELADLLSKIEFSKEEFLAQNPEDRKKTCRSISCNPIWINWLEQMGFLKELQEEQLKSIRNFNGNGDYLSIGIKYQKELEKLTLLIIQNHI